jgi:hypothetical protein
MGKLFRLVHLLLLSLFGTGVLKLEKSCAFLNQAAYAYFFKDFFLVGAGSVTRPPFDNKPFTTA